MHLSIILVLFKQSLNLDDNEIDKCLKQVKGLLEISIATDIDCKLTISKKILKNLSMTASFCN